MINRFTFDDTKAGLSERPSMVEAANRIRCIRTEKWKFDLYFDALGSYYNQYELYDLVNDPDEVNNLAYDNNYADIRAELEKRLHELEVAKLRKLHVAEKAESLLDKLVHKVTGK